MLLWFGTSFSSSRLQRSFFARGSIGNDSTGHGTTVMTSVFFFSISYLRCPRRVDRVIVLSRVLDLPSCCRTKISLFLGVTSVLFELESQVAIQISCDE